jgi:hypothetical protein
MWHGEFQGLVFRTKERERERDSISIGPEWVSAVTGK